jgi:hypothetical protein
MKSRNDYDIGCPPGWAPPIPTTAQQDSIDAFRFQERKDRETAKVIKVLAPLRSLRSLSSPQFVVAATAQTSVHRFERTERVAGVRVMDAEPGRLLHHVLRLHEHQLGSGSSTYPVGPAERHRAGRARSRASRRISIPRRSPFLFTIRVPKDFGTKEMTWTITTHGKTERAYASLKTDYQIDNQVMSTEVGGDFGSLRDELRTNIRRSFASRREDARRCKVGRAAATRRVRRRPRQPAGAARRQAAAAQRSGRMEGESAAPPAPCGARPTGDSDQSWRT